MYNKIIWYNKSAPEKTQRGKGCWIGEGDGGMVSKNGFLNALRDNTMVMAGTGRRRWRIKIEEWRRICNMAIRWFLRSTKNSLYY